MRGIVALLLLLCCCALAFAQVPQGSPHHGNSAPPDTLSEGHALDDGRTLGEGDASTNQCVREDGPSGTISFYICRAEALIFGSVDRVLIILLALLTLSTLLLLIYTRRVADAAKAAAAHIPAVERAYVFGGPTDLFLLHDQATVRLAMQNYGKTPAVIREWLVEFLAQEPRGRKPSYDESKRTVTNEILEPFKLFSPAAVFRSDVPAPFYIVGYIIYDDVFRRSHTTRFCVAVARDGKAAFGGQSAWNDYD